MATQQRVLVRKIPATDTAGARMTALNLSTRDSETIGYPHAAEDPYVTALFKVVREGAWYDPKWEWGPRGIRVYTVEV